MKKRGDYRRGHLKFSYRKVKWPTGRFIPERQEFTSYHEIKKRADEIKEISEKKIEILEDKNLYFIITFIELVNSPNISRLINQFGLLRITKIIDDYNAKFTLKKEHYLNFLAFLERKKQYFVNIRGVTLEDTFSESLLKELGNVEINKIDAIVEFSSVLLTELPMIKTNIQNYLNKSNGGQLKTCEKIGYNILCSLNIKVNNLKDLASKVDGINNIEKEQKSILTGFYLQGIEERTTRSHKAKLTQMPSSLPEKIDTNKLPVVAILDSGISNPNSKIDSNLIECTYDFETGNQTPCIDECGHGTFVSGRAIHGGDISKNAPLCKVAVAKLFKGARTQVRSSLSLLGMIEHTVRRFKDKTKVYNISFCKLGPETTFSKRLDYLAIENNVLFVNSSGNFDIPDIKYYLTNGQVYPEYLTELNVYPPADCFNILTVGSHTHKASNLCNVNEPSPFTRCIALNDRTKPEILCEGGNLAIIYKSGQIDDLTSNGLTVWSYSHQVGMDYAEGVGTSYAAPVAASIAGRLFNTYRKSSINLIKALMLNSCTLLQDQTGEFFDQKFQGFGVPNEYGALNSSKSKVTLFSEAEFDLKDKDRYTHEYKFHVPDDVWRIIITVVSTNPIEEQIPAGRLAVSLRYNVHRAGSKLKSPSTKANIDMSKKDDNVIHCIYDPKKGGRGVWTIKLKPSVLFPVNTQYLKYAIVVSQIARGSTNIYDEIEKWLENR